MQCILAALHSMHKNRCYKSLISAANFLRSIHLPRAEIGDGSHLALPFRSQSLNFKLHEERPESQTFFAKFWGP